MLTITRFAVENLSEGCVTDVTQPRFAFALNSDRSARLEVNGWQTNTDTQTGVAYGGAPLKSFTQYEATLTATDDAGETASAALTFETGRMGQPWQAQWISDPTYQFTEKKVSPIPMLFRKQFSVTKPVTSARLYATAMGIYELTLNGKKVGDQYFAPGFTSYKSQLQYQTYDVTDLLSEDTTLLATVAGGWAVGSFVFTRKNRITADRQALLCELRITYADGSQEIIGTDSSWEVTESGPVRMADIYDGETYDATVDVNAVSWNKAAQETLKIHPQLLADYGAPVKAHEELRPVSCKELPGGLLIYDFGQNFAGVVKLKLTGKAGQVVTVKHAEILNADGTLNVAFLRTAKATAIYTCRDGEQTYSPRQTYMGFRYVSVEGIGKADVEVSALVLFFTVEKNLPAEQAAIAERKKQE